MYVEATRPYVLLQKSGNILSMSWQPFGHAPGMFWTFVGHGLDMLWIIFRHVSGMCCVSEIVWQCFGYILGHVSALNCRGLTADAADLRLAKSDFIVEAAVERVAGWAGCWIC